MSPELDKKLCERYPKIFSQRNLPMNQTCMCWGFDHGDGWEPIISMMCAIIQSHINNTRERRAEALRYNRALKQALGGNKQALIKYFTYNNKISEYGMNQVEKSITSGIFRPVPDACPQVVVNQVKEKFGTLRFYYTGGDDFVDGVVRMGESMSGVMCEECSRPGNTEGPGWVKTLCPACRKKRDEEYAKNSSGI